MIEAFTKRWFERNHMVREQFEAAFPDSYTDILKAVVTMLHDEDEYNSPDPKRIHEIDEGDYQGTLVYVIGCTGYQPSTYWYVKVYYGSCSGCDTLERIREDATDWEDNWNERVDDQRKKEGVDQLMTLALHIVQGLKEMGEDEV